MGRGAGPGGGLRGPRSCAWARNGRAVFDRARAEQREEAPLRVLGRERGEVEDLARGERAVHAGEDEAVGGREGQLLRAQDGMRGGCDHAVDVAQHRRHDRRLLDAAGRLQDHLPGSDARLQLLLQERVFAQLLERELHVRHLGDVEEHLAHVELDRALQLALGHEAHGVEHGPELLALGEDDLARFLEVVLGEEAVADEHVAEMFAFHVAGGVEDLALEEAEAAPLLGPREMQVAGAAPTKMSRMSWKSGLGSTMVRRSSMIAGTGGGSMAVGGAGASSFARTGAGAAGAGVGRTVVAGARIPSPVENGRSASANSVAFW